MMVDFKFDAYAAKSSPEVGLVKKFNRKFVLVGDTARAIPT